MSGGHRLVQGDDSPLFKVTCSTAVPVVQKAPGEAAPGRWGCGSTCSAGSLGSPERLSPCRATWPALVGLSITLLRKIAPEGRFPSPLSCLPLSYPTFCLLLLSLCSSQGRWFQILHRTCCQQIDLPGVPGELTGAVSSHLVLRPWWRCCSAGRSLAGGAGGAGCAARLWAPGSLREPERRPGQTGAWSCEAPGLGARAGLAGTSCPGTLPAGRTAELGII